MPQAIADGTWKTLTTAFTEQVEDFKLNCCEKCLQKDAGRKADVVRAVKKFLRDTNGDEHISDREMELSIAASFMFPSSARVTRTRDVNGTKEWLRLTARPGE